MNKLHNKSILIIDDNTRMLCALDKVLAGKGAVVTLAKWAGDALDLLTATKSQFDLVITDLRMPFVSESRLFTPFTRFSRHYRLSF